MGTYNNFDNSELWEHIQSELWHFIRNYGILPDFQVPNKRSSQTFLVTPGHCISVFHCNQTIQIIQKLYFLGKN
jgi:hypothetical protein